MMQISERGLELVRVHEGLRLEAYQCPAGIWTIGYGHTGGVRPGDKITRDEAEHLLLLDMEVKAERPIAGYVRVPLDQHQFDALCSFVYNIGPAAFSRSTMCALLNERKFKQAAEQFDRWVYGGGKVLNGLVVRRHDERAMFEGK